MKQIVELPNFGVNLDHIHDFWKICQIDQNYFRLIEDVTHQMYSSLGAFPYMGRLFTVDSEADQQIQTRAIALLTRAKATLDGIEVREYLLEDYLVLYGVDQLRIYLIAIKHHKQSGFSIGSR